MLYIMPLCLKLRGRIVGAVSRSTIGIYIALGLLMLSSLLLIIVFSSITHDPGTVAQPQPQKQIEQQVSIPVQKEIPMIPVLPQETPEKDALVIPAMSKDLVQVDFGWQFHQVYHDWRYHTGIDIRGALGQSVEAIDKGQVVDVYRDPQSGLTVVIKNSRWTIYYGSLSQVRVSKDGDISPGQTIGSMGRCDAEPYDHLHLAIKEDGEYIDPKRLMNDKNKESIQN